MIAPIRVATLGAGYFSRFHHRAWARIPEVGLVGICDLDAARAGAFAAEHGAEAAYADLATMLREARPDILDIVTPPPTHLSAIRMAAEAGVDVICQKPFCATLAEASDALALARAHSISIAVHENFRFQPWHREIRNWIAGGRLGRVFQATFRLRPGDGRGTSAYLDRQPYFQAMPRFLIHETAIHLIDVFRFLFGEPEAVTALLRRLNPAIAGEDAGLFVLDMANGVRCVFDGNRLSDHAAVNRRLTMGEFVVEGEAGVLSLDGDARLWFRAHGSNEVQPVPYPWEDIDFGGDCVHSFQRHVVEARLAGACAETAAESYIANLRVEEAIYESHDGGRRIRL
jgi:predicted dehydrogenase